MNSARSLDAQAPWPYALTLTGMSGMQCRATLYRGPVAVAKVVLTLTPEQERHPPGAEVDLRFAVPEHEAAFLTWMNGVHLPPGTDRSAEGMVELMYFGALSQEEARQAEARNLAQDSADAVQTGLEVWSSIWQHDPDVIFLSSELRPMALAVACSRAVTLEGEKVGLPVDLNASRQEATDELVALAEHLMAGDLKYCQTRHHSARSMTHLLRVLASIGSQFGHTRDGRMRRAEQTRLQRLTDRLFPDRPSEQATSVLDLCALASNCEHETLLRTLSLILRVPARGEAPQGEPPLIDLLALASALMQTLSEVAGLDVNAELRRTLRRTSADRPPRPTTPGGSPRGAQ